MCNLFMKTEENRHKLIRYGDAHLRKECILSLDADFQRIREEGLYRGGKFMTVGVYQGDDINFKVAFITSKKVHKRAVKRNLARRRLREALRLSKSRFKKDCWLVIIAKPTILKASVVEIQRELIYLARKTDVWTTIDS
ncbi:MAG: ribonuclease P protein component [Lentisphaeria bacterium]